jgi:glycosyltransferase involved in cell wall biosynthesis
VNVLYVSHTSAISGAERSLLELINGLPDEVAPTLACPAGELAAAAQEIGVPVVTVAGTDMSLRLHPWHTTLGVVAIARSAFGVRRIAQLRAANLVHANSARAGLAAVLAARLGAPPAIVHVRDVLPRSAAGNLTRRAIGASAAAVLTNSRYTAAKFSHNGFRIPVRTVYNAVDLRRFDPGRLTRGEARTRLGLPDDSFVMGVVGQITPWKGQDTAIRALEIVSQSRPETRLLVVGEPKFTFSATRYRNEAFNESLRELAAERGVADLVLFLGAREDLPDVIRALDLVLVPSWEEPFGRTVLEGMAMEVPVLATNMGGPPEIISDGNDGVLLPPRDVEAWAAAIDRLAADDRLRREIGKRGRKKVERSFGIDRHVAAVLAAYREVLALGEAS